jgi:beta-glucoside kinase
VKENDCSKSIDDNVQKKYIAFDIGGTKVKYGVLLENGTILSKSSYSTVCDDLDLFLESMINAINVITIKHVIEGVAISMPGFIDVNTGYTDRAGSITCLHGRNLKELLENEISLPVEVENDGNCAALAEKLNGNATECDDFICVTIGTGIGGGIFTNGKIVHGNKFQGGEFGFMLTPASTEEFKTMHQNASTSSLINSYRKYKGIEEYIFIDGEEIFIEANEDIYVKTIIDNWFRNISFGIYNLAVTLNPQKILIGGGISAREEIMEEIINKLEQIPFWNVFKVPVEVCKHRNDAGLLGALYHFQNKLPFKTQLVI